MATVAKGFDVPLRIAAVPAGFLLAVSILLSGLANAGGKEVSIADYLADPGFEAAHQANQQLNAPGVTGASGWTAAPQNGNFWTSVSYVDADGKTLGDKRDAIAPAEGRSYLRMFTQNSSDWLAVQSPVFPMESGAAYAIAFKVSADSQPPMSRLEVALKGANGTLYGPKIYDLISLEPGWNTFVYQCAYAGPNQDGVLQLTARREKTGKIGSLNFDDFKAPEKEGMSGANGMEVSGFPIGLPLRETSWNRTIMPLEGTNPTKIKLAAPPGKYRLLVKLRSSDRSGNEGDSMLGGYTYLLPQSRYHFTMDGRPLEMEISPRMVKAEGRESEDVPVFTGWVYSAIPIEVSTSSELTVSCDKAGGFLSEVLLLDESAWEAEKLRSSGKFVNPPGKGFGDAWAGMLTRPVQWYPVKSLQRMLQALKIFSESGFVTKAGGEMDFASLQDLGETLATQVDAYVARPPTRDASFHRQGAGLVEEWKSFFGKTDETLQKQILPLIDEWEKRAKESVGKANPECFAGREARFNAGVAVQYLAECRARLKALGNSRESCDATPEILALTFAQNGAEFLLKAEDFASRPQGSVSFPEYEVKEESNAGRGKTLTSEEKIVINGQWDFSPGEPDRPPAQWAPTNIPNNGPAYFFNKNNISDDQWSKDFGVYWTAGSIKNAWFKTDFEVPASWKGNKLVVRFEELTLYAEVFVNGHYCGNHYGGFVPFEINITDHAKPGQKNNLLVFVTSHSKTERGKIKDIRDKGMIFGNLYPRNQLENNESLRISGDVEIVAKPPLRIEDTYVSTSLKDQSITVQSTLVNDTGDAVEGSLTQTAIRKGNAEFLLPVQSVRLEAGQRKVITTSAKWKTPHLWGIGGEYGDPENRYTLKSVLTAGSGVSEAFTEFGFRELTINGRDFVLNGIKLPLQGDSYSDSGRYQYQHNRWAQEYMNKFRRMANINLVRPHRFNFSNALIDASNRSGMLVEGEAPWWSVNLYAPSDITGKPCFDDPVWLSNARDYYHGIIKATRNQPSLVLWSAENESLTADNVDAVLKFREWSEEMAPHLIVTNHSHASAWDKRFPIAVLHDYDLGVERIREWSRVSETAPKPSVIGEFWNIDLYRKMWLNRDAAQARAAERIMSKWLERSVRSYEKAGASGSMPYTFNSLGSLYSNGSVETMGPWGDLILERWKDEAKKDIPVVVYPSWPSPSGLGGIRPDKKRLGGDNYVHLNVFDPTRPVATLTTVMDGYRKAFAPMPQNPIMRPPEILVQVVDNGVPVPGINVFAVPKPGTFGEPTGVKGDSEGKSWIQAAEAGVYDIYFEAAGREFRHEFKLDGTPLGPAGFDYLPRVKWNIGTGNVDLIPGKAPGDSLPPKSKSVVETPAARAKEVHSQMPSVGPDGFIRQWLVYGPFPNYGGRESRNKDALEQDLLTGYGGEASISPAPGGKETVEFKKIDHAYWDDGSIDISWHAYGSDKDRVDLADAFIRPEIPGLDGALQYVFGYAACYVESDRDQDVTLAIGSDDGYKIWLNHQLVASKRVYRGCVPDSEKYPVKLKKGWNPVLVKVEQDNGGYEFALRFFDAGGKPMAPHTSVSLPKDAPPLAINQWLKEWLVCGPFPNRGERPNGKGFNTDFLERNGGERAVRPTAGETLAAIFPEDGQAYWDKGTIQVKWTRTESKTDDINLGDIFVRPDVPGLDVAPVQYVTGYAWTEFSLVKASAATLQVHTYNGLKVWLNGELVVNDSGHTYNRDPNSAVLPESKEKEIRVPVTLRAGVNSLLVKPDVDYGPFSFRIRFLGTEDMAQTKK